MSLLVALLLAQSMNLNQQPVICMDEALYCRSDRKQAFEVNCSGAGITCAQVGGRMTLTVPGGGAAGKVAEAYAADASITAQYLPITCSAGDFITCNGTSCSCSTPSGGPGGKVAEAYMADASIFAQTANVAYAADASYLSYFSLTANVAYSADAGYYAHVSRVSYAADASYLAYTAQVSQVAYSTDASYSSILAGTSAVAYSADASYSSTVASYLPLTCSAGDFVTCSGTSCSCSTPSGGGGGGYATIQDEGSGLTQRTTLNFAGAGVSCVDDTTRTTCTISGGGGGSTSPGGVLGSVQYYSDAGVFGGMSGLGTDGTDLIFVDRSTHATAAVAGTSALYFYDHYGSGGPGFPQIATETLGFDTHLNPIPFTRSDDSWWGCIVPGAFNSTTLTATGRAIAGSATGTAAAVAWASTDERTRAMWIQYPSATTASSSAGYRANTDTMWRGNAAGIGGWLWNGAFNIVTTTANQRLFVGLKDATAVITATTNPSAQLDTVYFGCDAGQTTIRICSNDNSGAATCTDLGASFPCTTANVAYDVALWSAANGSSIGYWIRRLVDGSTASGTVSSDLPRNTVQLGWDFWINNGGTAAASTMHFGGTCWWANP